MWYYLIRYGGKRIDNINRIKKNGEFDPFFVEFGRLYPNRVINSWTQNNQNNCCDN
jgi:hypothetical protein